MIDDANNRTWHCSLNLYKLLYLNEEEEEVLSSEEEELNLYKLLYLNLNVLIKMVSLEN